LQIKFDSFAFDVGL